VRNLPTTLPLTRFVALYAILYASYGVASPFLPAVLQSRGLSAEQIGLVFAAGTAIKLVAAPLAGWIADRWAIRRRLVSICTVLAAFSGLLYATAYGAGAILITHILLSVMLAPLSPFADALALVASSGKVGATTGRFEYGWVRGAGSAAFVAGSILVGLIIPATGFMIIFWLQAFLLAGIPLLARRVPEPPASSGATHLDRKAIVLLLGDPVFRKVLLVAALILGSHAMHDTFSVIRWTAAGISPTTASLLWSVSVIAEVIVFVGIGPWLLRILQPATAISFAALAGAIRWGIAASTVDPTVLTFLQLLHGLTFALLHLACMRLLGECVPPRLSATAQAIYGTLAVGLATAALTFASGWLYARMGPQAFALMSLLCLAALPVTATLRNR
jgi:MFS transporter, PPP family, 3-phenylpropionic acid transporter